MSELETAYSGVVYPPLDVHAKPATGLDFVMEKPLKHDLRVAAIANYACMGANGIDESPRIGAKYQHSVPTSPTNANSNNASETVLDEPNVSLKRQSSFSSDGAGQPRRSRSPARPAGAPAVAHDLSASQEEAAGAEDPCGLDFLLQACHMLEPSFHNQHQGRACLNAARRAVLASSEPSHSQGSYSRHARRRCDEAGDYVSGEFLDEGEEDQDYKPTTRSGRTSRRTVAAAAAIRAAGHQTRPAGAMPRWERGAVSGPCQNPDCESPYNSPQWRKGPPQHPILCNACGTRWLRNGTLKPLVPRRGIRYHRAQAQAAPRGSSRRTKQPAATYTEEEDVRRGPGRAARPLASRDLEPEHYEQAYPAASEPPPAAYHPQAPAPAAYHYPTAAGEAEAYGHDAQHHAPSHPHSQPPQTAAYPDASAMHSAWMQATAMLHNPPFEAMAAAATLHQQLTAMSAAAKHAMAAAAAAAAAAVACSADAECRAAPQETARPVYHLTATAGTHAAPAQHHTAPAQHMPSSHYTATEWQPEPTALHH